MIAPCIQPRLITMSPENIVDWAMIDLVQQVEVNCSTMNTSRSGFPALNYEDNNSSSTKRRRLAPEKYFSHHRIQHVLSKLRMKCNPPDNSVKSDNKDKCHYDTDLKQNLRCKIISKKRI